MTEVTLPDGKHRIVILKNIEHDFEIHIYYENVFIFAKAFPVEIEEAEFNNVGHFVIRGQNMLAVYDLSAMPSAKCLMAHHSLYPIGVKKFEDELIQLQYFAETGIIPHVNPNPWYVRVATMKFPKRIPLLKKA